MSNDQTKQQENNLNTQNTSNNTKNNINYPDIFLLAQLLPALNNATWYLKQLLNKLAVDAEAVAKMPYSALSIPEVWGLKEAKENFDILVLNAVLGRTEKIKYEKWIVELQSKKASEAVNK